jgi:RimJ/RimL family protein N-acetyltransferase
MSTVRTISPAPSEIHVGDYVVRRYEISDAPELVRAVTESLIHLSPWMPWAKFEPQSVVQKEELIRSWSVEWDTGTNFTMGIFLGERVVGGTGLNLRGAENTVEIGYWVHVDYIGKGIATQVSRALTESAFALWEEIDTVEIHHDEANIASGKVPQHLGFQHVRTVERIPEAPSDSGVGYHWAMARRK